MARHWYYRRGGQQLGPVPASELKKLADVLQLQPTDLVWAEGMKEWQPASRIQGLFPTPPPPPAPSPPLSVPPSTEGFDFGDAQPADDRPRSRKTPGEGDDEFRRPRRNAKKHKTGVIIALSLGGVALLIAVIVLIIILVGGGATGVTGKYVSDDNEKDYLELKSDSTFFLQENGTVVTGKYEIQGDQLTLKADMGVVRVVNIRGRLITNHKGDRYTKH